jgi:hypothetical protein
MRCVNPWRIGLPRARSVDKDAELVENRCPMWTTSNMADDRFVEIGGDAVDDPGRPGRPLAALMMFVHQSSAPGARLSPSGPPFQVTGEHRRSARPHGGVPTVHTMMTVMTR